MERLCGNCEYRAEHVLVRGITRVCRRYPPILVGEDPQWPIVFPGDWCGEFVPKSDPNQGLLASGLSLELSTRVRSSLLSMGAVTYGDLIKRTANDVLEYRNFAKVSLREVRKHLAKLGLRLHQDPLPVAPEVSLTLDRQT